MIPKNGFIKGRMQMKWLLVIALLLPTAAFASGDNCSHDFRCPPGIWVKLCGKQCDYGKLVDPDPSCDAAASCKRMTEVCENELDLALDQLISCENNCYCNTPPNEPTSTQIVTLADVVRWVEGACERKNRPGIQVRGRGDRVKIRTNARRCNPDFQLLLE